MSKYDSRHRQTAKNPSVGDVLSMATNELALARDLQQYRIAGYSSETTEGVIVDLRKSEALLVQHCSALLQMCSNFLSPTAEAVPMPAVEEKQE
jgi:hypothetical protein